MRLTNELDKNSKEGTLYDALRENVKEISGLLVGDEGGRDKDDDEAKAIAGAIETFGYAIVDGAESLDRIADALEEQFV